MPPPVINITIHKLNTMQFRHVGADHPIYPKIVEIARALARRDSVDGVVTPDEMLPSHSSFLAILNATTSVLEHSGLHLSRLDPLSRQKTICFSIDLNNMVVRDVTQGSEGIPDFPLPADEGVQNELKIFITEQVNEWKKDEESRRQEQEIKRKQEHERRRKNAIVFLHRLVELELVDPEVLEHDAPTTTCPLCSHDLIRCRACGVHACENSSCKASSIVSVVGCSYHDREFFCVPCATPQTGRCPICSQWYCMESLSWCVGRPEGGTEWTPTPRPNHTAFEIIDPIKDPDTEDDHQPISHEHPPRIAPCRDCVRQGLASAWCRCGNLYCWSRNRNRFRDMVCSDCEPGGRTCACSRTWLCGLCSADPSGTPFINCPSCKVVYCQDWCAYIQSCTVCSRTRLCDDCIEEEGDTEQLQLPCPRFTGKCGICRRHICDNCVPRLSRCSSCGHCYCHRCRWTEAAHSCKTCASPMCRDCTRNWDDCRQCIDAKYPGYKGHRASSLVTFPPLY
ncbi:uncharacterized protein BJ212DRAFT_1031993 [Suillus subaureus]|uniref:Uncharacterized protein n=1 Tax=Suillus subaureus TaxID=48587 RepID=A0A9P7JG84_9AGAM|nr:uncharacterized protein BJ212DRAFT_1031993 [Suillus subaureus]KAG1820473.1 hypothetical protein BJ212DRAFT_1031993 [Suillus subaureus]